MTTPSRPTARSSSSTGQPRTAGRKGHRWRTLRQAILTASDICRRCGHPGANEVDHIIARSIRPDLAMVAANLAPIHGAARYDRALRRWFPYACPVCGRRCNQEKGNGLGAVRTTGGSRDW